MTEGDTGGRRAPDPRTAGDPAAFIALLQELKDRSGLTYRELSSRAEAQGDVLPRSTVANMLARTTLPREELLTSFVRACGVGAGELEGWQAVRTELAARGVYDTGPAIPSGTSAEANEEPDADEEPDANEEADADDGPDADEEAGEREPGSAEAEDTTWPSAPAPAAEPSAPEPPRWRIGRTLVTVVAVAGLVLAALSLVLTVVRDDGGSGPRRLTAPAEGEIRIRVIGSDLCLNERRGSRNGQVHQVPCEDAVVPLYSLKNRGGHWQILSDHPDYGPGCSGIPSGGRIPDAPLEDSECGDPARLESFAVEPFGTPVTGYRIRPEGSATRDVCVTVVGDRTAAWARLAQAPCRPDAAGQLFSFDRRADAT